jgi:transketolase
LAAHHQLSNLCCIVDFNHSTDRALRLGDLAAKFKSFGWEVITTTGHDHDAIKNALSNHPTEKPLLVIAETTKGYGVKRMENDPAWHHRSPNADELKSIIEELS